MGLFDIFTSKNSDALKAAGLQAQQQLGAAGAGAQGTFNAAGQTAQRDFTALGSNAAAGYNGLAGTAGNGFTNLANTATGAVNGAATAAAPLYDQARGEYNGLSFAPDQYGGTMRAGYSTLADATGANGQAGFDRARTLFTQTPGYAEGLDRAVNEATRVGNARGVAVGNAMADTTKLATSYADQNYGNFVNRLSPFANAPGQQLSRDTAAADYAARLAGARAGIDTTQGGNVYNAGTHAADLAAQLGGQGVSLAAQLGGRGVDQGLTAGTQGANLAYQGATGGASANLGAITAGTQASLQAQEEAAKAKAASDAAVWNAILGGGKLAVGAYTGVPPGVNAKMFG
jgi:hypothetical protein